MGVALAPPPCAAAGVPTLGNGRLQPGPGHHGFLPSADQRCPTLGRRELVRAAAEMGEGSGGAAACQSGAHLGVGERRRRQRLQHEFHQRAAAAAATGRAYTATLEQRERQRTAVAEETERLRAEWAAAAAAAMPRRGPAGPSVRRPGAGSKPGSARSSGGGPGAATRSGSGSGAAADSTASSRRPPQQPRDARFWLLYAMHWRHFESESTSFDADDCWGTGPSAGAASSSGGEGAAADASSGAAAGATAGAAADGGPDYDFWRQFVREATKGFRSQQSAWGSAASSWADAAHGWGSARASAAQQQHAAAAAAAGAGASLEQQVRAELTGALAQAGGDLARFVSELGIPFERAADRRSLLRNARTAALLRLHPDKLRASDERQQVFGLLATQILNELWMAEKAAARA